MAIKFAGAFEVNALRKRSMTSSPIRTSLRRCCRSFEACRCWMPTHFTVKVNVGISYIKGVADVKMELSEAERPKRAQYKGQGSVAGGQRSDGCRRSTWRSPDRAPKWFGRERRRSSGALTSVAGGLLEPLGKKQVQKLIDGLQAALQCSQRGHIVSGDGKKWVGKAVPRKEEERLLRGLGKFADDIKLRDMLYLRFVRSPYAHAKIVGVDTAEAEKIPGVVCTLTGAEIASQTQPFIEIAPDAGGKIRDFRWRCPKSATRASPWWRSWPCLPALLTTVLRLFRWTMTRSIPWSTPSKH